MKFTLATVLLTALVGVQAVPHPQVTAPPNVKCPTKQCGTATVTKLPEVCAAVLCPPPPTCILIASVTNVPCCCKTAKIPTTTVTAPCCTTKCVIPTFTEYTGCPTPTATKVTKKTTTTRVFNTWA